MKPTRHPSCNTVLRGGAPHIPDLHIRRGFDSDDDSMPVVASYWRPTDAELKELLEGGCVEIVVLGYTHPPLSIRTATHPEPQAGKGEAAPAAKGEKL